jgi:VWFA-related protein
VDTEAVHLDVLVTDGKRPVAGLGASDFVVRDNGVVQTTRLVERGAAPLTAILLLDLSWSVAGERLAQVKRAADAFLAPLAERDRVGVVAVRHDVSLVTPPSTDRAQVRSALQALKAGGFTSVVDAAWMGLARDWGPGRTVLVLFSDGEDSTSFLANDDVLQAARESNAQLHVVALRRPPPPWLDTAEQETSQEYLLRRAAEITGGRSVKAPDAAALDRLFREIAESVTARYVLAYEPAGTPRPGRHQIEVSVRRRGLKLSHRREYVVPAPAPERR